MNLARFGVCAALLTAAALTGAPAAHAAPTAADRTFLVAAHQGNLAEIASGQDAQANATTSCVREVGAVLIRDHRKLDAQAAPVARRYQVALPNAPTPAQRQALAAVKAKAGTAGYDAAWLRTQEAAHRQTLALIDTEIESGSDSQVKALARAARPVVAMHLDMVRGGECRSGHGASAVNAGSGGQAAATRSRAAEGLGLAAAGAALLAAGGIALARRRRQGMLG